eukprot:TRINITY_DN14257_c0_g2_i2.p1 TRINITY_DN14257_c0_g2~~TRINITY_DN14257_c0_g2_i2.p1  ORF type:complete len:576 (-),score=113.32 TRINITY_DN14257_c0_g2_i2:270-1997(-)
MDFFRAVLFDTDDGGDKAKEEGEDKELTGDEGSSNPEKKEGEDEIEEEGGEGEDEDGEEVEEEEEQLSLLGGTWDFGSLIQTIATKSEQVLREYGQELQDFGEGLKKETEELVETTASTVQELPSSLETGVEVAQSSLEEFGSSIWKGTSEILAQVQEAVALVEEEVAANAAGRPRGPPAPSFSAASISRGKYSRYEALVSAMQRDSSTYCDEPEDSEEFSKWQETFDLKNKEADIEAVLKDNAFMQELQSRIVPLIVEREAFWTRYFFRLHKLQQAEDARADLVKRATTSEEEDLSWDVDDEGDEATTSADDPAKQNAAVKEGGKQAGAASADAKEADAGGKASGANESAEAKTEESAESAKKEVDVAAVLPPRIEDAGLEDTALSLDQIQEAFRIASKPSDVAAAALPTAKDAAADSAEVISDVSSGSSAGSEWQVVSKEDATARDGPADASNPTVAPAGAATSDAAASSVAATGAAAAAAAPAESDKAGSEAAPASTEGSAVAASDAAAPEVAAAGETAAAESTEESFDEFGEVEVIANAKAEKGRSREGKGEGGKGAGGEGEEDEDWGEWE